MDVQSFRARTVSILNDSDCPSFAIRPRQNPPSPPKSNTAQPPKQERPALYRQGIYKRQSSTCTASSSSSSSPPLLRLDSSSSKSSSSSMDSSPSPITPVYNYYDQTLMPYDALLRPEGQANVPSATTITPYLEQSMTFLPSTSEQMMQYPAKGASGQITASSYPAVPPGPTEVQQTPTPASSSNSATTSQSQTQPQASQHSSNTTGKKNKYPCPYAATHHCSATFTTSGHAARHGKKHTGEKGVHCPVCNKAFTRKDNMKQHERTHKGSLSGSNSDESVARKSKAAATRVALKAKKKIDAPRTPAPTSRKSSIIHSPLSEVASIAPPSVIEQSPLSLEEPVIYGNPSTAGITMPVETVSADINGMYPPIVDEAMLNPAASDQAYDKSTMMSTTAPTRPGIFPRGFSDLDTLAHAAETFDPYFSTNKF